MFQKCVRVHFPGLVIFFLIVIFINSNIYPQVPCTPAWHGQIIIDCETVQNWQVEFDQGSSGSLKLTTGFIDQALQFNWNLGTGDWVQAKYTFPEPVNLAQLDLFGLSLHGSLGQTNRVSLMFADINGVFYGTDCDGINTLNRWLKNLPFPKKLFYHFFTIGPNPNLKLIDWSQINRFFVVVKRPAPAEGGGSGQLLIDHLQADRAADWPRQEQFETIMSDTAAVNRAVKYLLSQQMTSGLFRSWQEESEPRAYLYDQALTLIVFAREGKWANGIPLNEAAQQAQKLVAFLCARQKPDGHWARAWHPETGDELVDDRWIGDQAWWVMALAEYLNQSKDPSAANALQKGADWLEKMIQPTGKVVPSTEGTVDVWWAMIANQRFESAELIQHYLLTQVWDRDLQYWWRGRAEIPDPVIAMDAATWLTEFAKSPRVNRPEMALAALSFVRRTLVTTDDSGMLCGFDGQGPVSIWCEGTAQYISAGGTAAQSFLEMLLSLQRADGGMPGSPNNWSSECFGWLSSWTGLAPTAWLYFALTRPPFPTIQTNVAVSSGASFNQPQAADFILWLPFPNPFNNFVTLSYLLKHENRVQITIFNISGKEVLKLGDSLQPAGNYQIKLNVETFAAGLYFCQLRAGLQTQTRKLLLLK